MEKYCGLELSNTNKDFEDGELKTSEIKESTQITMITNWIDEIIHGNPLEFEKTLLFKKIENNFNVIEKKYFGILVFLYPILKFFFNVIEYNVK